MEIPERPKRITPQSNESNKPAHVNTTYPYTTDINRQTEIDIDSYKSNNTTISRNTKIWMPWVIVMSLLFLIEIAKLGISFINMINYDGNAFSIIMFSIDCFLLLLLATLSIIHHAKQEYFKDHSSPFFWLFLVLIMIGSAGISLFALLTY